MRARRHGHRLHAQAQDVFRKRTAARSTCVQYPGSTLPVKRSPRGAGARPVMVAGVLTLTHTAALARTSLAGGSRRRVVPPNFVLDFFAQKVHG